MFLSYRTDISGQTVQTQIRLLQEEQSGQGFHVFTVCHTWLCTVMTLFSERQVWANSKDPEPTAPPGAVRSGFSLFAIPFASFGQNILWFYDKKENFKS